MNSLSRLIKLPVALLLPLSLSLASCAVPDLSRGDQQTSSWAAGAGTASTSKPATADYADVLRRHVDERGRVDYAALKADRGPLDRYALSLGAIPKATYEGWPEAEKIAFLINAYNAFTLVSIIDRYPVNSIRDIRGVWRGRRFPLAGQSLTLDAIEHQILRKQFQEPRIHLAVNCASIGCPVLRPEPYSGERLSQQLDEQGKAMVVDPSQFRIDRARGRVNVSSVFKWFGEDFEPLAAENGTIAGLTKRESGVVAFLIPYLSADDRRYLEKGGYKVGYLDWDWGLNDTSREPG